MRRNESHYFGVLLALVMSIVVSLAQAEVYKWVDAEGNIHFGDKPRDSTLADQAESVDIVESYQPNTESVQDREAFEREQEAIRRKTALFRNEDAERRKLEQVERSERKAELCTALAEDIRKFGSMQLINGTPTYHYLKGEDGKSLSSRRQAEIVEELREKYSATGCN